MSEPTPREKGEAVTEYTGIEKSDFDSVEDWLDFVDEQFAELKAETEEAKALAQKAQTTADKNRDILKNLLRVEYSDVDDEEHAFFPTPTDGRGRVAAERRRALLSWVFQEAEESNEDIAWLYKRGTKGKPRETNAQFALRRQGLKPPHTVTIGEDLRAIAEAVPGAKWEQDDERGKNRKVLKFNGRVFMDEWEP